MICQGQKCHTTLCLHYSKLAIQPGTSMIMQIEALLPYQNPWQNAWETDFNKGDTFYLSKVDINNLWLISLWKHINNRRLWTARWISCLHFPHFSPFLPDLIFFMTENHVEDSILQKQTDSLLKEPYGNAELVMKWWEIIWLPERLELSWCQICLLHLNNQAYVRTS